MQTQAAPLLEGYTSLVSEDSHGTKTLSVLVKGVNCAGCIQKIESTLNSRPDVTEARLNFSTGRLNIQWKGDVALSNAYVRDVESLGYGVYPLYADSYHQDQDQESRFLLLCLGVAGFAMGNIMLLSVILWTTDGTTMGVETRQLFHWISALIAMPTIVFSGRPFFRSAWAVLSKGHSNMDVPISLALLLATGMSLAETLRYGEHVYFDSAVMLAFFLLVGRYLDFRARRNARSAATDLLQTLSGFATVVETDQTRDVLIRDLRPGMLVRVAVGQKVPIDGVVRSGAGTIDTSLITGETLPRAIAPGEKVFAGMINLSGVLEIEVSQAAENSLLADIVRLMEKAQQGQAKYVQLADRAARLYTPVVHLLAVLAFVFQWGMMGMAWQDALMVAVTVLIITCPCALGLAVPVMQVLAIGLLMKKNVLVKSGDALERLSAIDTVIFDKTGTLTQGKFSLKGEYDPAHLQMAASVAAHSAHPLSRALVAAYGEKDLLPVAEVQEYAGQGVEARIGGAWVRLGSRKWCGTTVEATDADTDTEEYTEIWLQVDGKRAAVFTFEDQPRYDAETVVREFQGQGIEPYLLSGDRNPVVQNIAARLGIPHRYAEQTPVDKNTVLERLKKEGHQVLMVGDGLNDAPVLAAANVSMAPGTAVDMAQNAADIVFMGDALSPVFFAYKTARFAQRLVKQNFALAIMYNCIAVPLAFMGMVTPMVAAIAMSGSSLLVIANSYRLRFSL